MVSRKNATHSGSMGRRTQVQTHGRSLVDVSVSTIHNRIVVRRKPNVNLNVASFIGRGPRVWGCYSRVHSTPFYTKIFESCKISILESLSWLRIQQFSSPMYPECVAFLGWLVSPVSGNSLYYTTEITDLFILDLLSSTIHQLFKYFE